MFVLRCKWGRLTVLRDPRLGLEPWGPGAQRGSGRRGQGPRGAGASNKEVSVMNFEHQGRDTFLYW